MGWWWVLVVVVGRGGDGGGMEAVKTGFWLFIILISFFFK
jgi:hypothetical protein